MNTAQPQKRSDKSRPVNGLLLNEKNDNSVLEIETFALHMQTTAPHEYYYKKVHIYLVIKDKITLQQKGNELIN